jgi:hypothetical protein
MLPAGCILGAVSHTIQHVFALCHRRRLAVTQHFSDAGTVIKLDCERCSRKN